MFYSQPINILLVIDITGIATRRLLMLRLSVNKDEYLMVGDNVKITFLGGNNNSIKIMIDAPKEINVARGKAIAKRAAASLENQ